MVFNILLHAYKSSLRSYRSKSIGLAALFVKGAAFLYVTAIVIGTGWTYGTIVRHLDADLNPTAVLHHYVAWALGIGFAVRLAVSGTTIRRVQPYLTLPISKSTLALYASLAAGLGGAVIVPSAFGVAFWAAELAPRLSFIESTAYLVGWIGSFALCSFAALIVQHGLSARAGQRVSVAVLGSMTAAAVLFGIAPDVVHLQIAETVGATFNDLSSGSYSIGLAMGAAALLLGFAYTRLIYCDLAVDRQGAPATHRRSVQTGPPLTKRLGGEPLLFWRRLVTRCWAARTVLGIGLLVGLCATVAAPTLMQSALQGDTSFIGRALSLIVALYGTGGILFFAAGNVASFKESYGSAIRTRPQGNRTDVSSFLAMLQGCVVLSFLVALPITLYLGVPALRLHAGFALFNAGLSAPLLVAGARWIRFAANPHPASVSDGSNGSTIIPMVGVLALALASAWLVARFPARPYEAIAIAGAISLLATPLWNQLIARISARRPGDVVGGMVRP